jgi:phosphoserine phosphatase
MVEKHSLDFSGSLGIGDGHSDVSMLELVDTPIAFNPEKALFDHASQQGWKVVVERKNMVYELEKRDGNYQLVKTDG